MTYSPLLRLPRKKRYCFTLSLNYKKHYLNIKVLKTCTIGSWFEVEILIRVESLRIKLGVDSMPDIKRKCLRGPHKNRKNVQHMVEKLRN